MDEETRFARVEVTVTSADGTVRTFAADWPAKAGVTVETGFQAALRSGQPWQPSAMGPHAPARLLVEVEADGKRPLAMTTAKPPEGRDVITTQDRELLDPVLGDERMTALMGRDREAWTLAGALLVRAFTAGKRAAGRERKP